MAEDRGASPLRALHGAMRDASSAAVALREIVLPCQIGLRGDPEDGALLAAVQSVVGGSLPLAPNTVVAAPPLSMLWLGPDEWLLAGAANTAALVVQLEAALAGRHCAVVDLSASRAVLELSGPHSRSVLAKGCGLDLHPRVFAPGRCAQTLLARTGVILEQLDTVPSWRLFARRSFAEYLAQWLIDAMREFAG